MKRAALLFVFLLALSPVSAQSPVEEDVAADEKTMGDAGFSTDVPGLLDFFRKLHG